MHGILSDSEILRALDIGDIEIEPFDRKRVNPVSVDLTLGNDVAVYVDWTERRLSTPPENGALFCPTTSVCDVKKELAVEHFKIDVNRGWVLRPGIGYLMHVNERIHTKKFVPILDGKALALDTEIPTPDGWKRMIDLREGDFVYGADGHPTEIVAATKAMANRPCYRLRFSDGTCVVADASHQWFVYPTDAKPSVRTTAQMASRRCKKGTAIFRVLASPVMGVEEKLPIGPYTLGAWLGGGTTSCAHITLHNRDVQILNEIRKDGSTVEARAKKGDCTTHIINRKSLVRDPNGRYLSENGSLHAELRSLGVLNKKHIPDLYKRASFQQRWALLQGLMDTDGTVHRDDQASITLSDEQLFNDTEELCRSLGLVTYRDERPSKLKGRTVGTAYRLTWRATPELFRLDRKRQRVRSTPQWLKAARHPFRGIVAIEPVESVPVRCITVKAKDGLFLTTRAFITTHNSSIGRLFIQVHATAGFGDPGFSGQFTLEVIVQHPVRVYPGMPIAQVRFQTIAGEVSKPYDGNYKGGSAVGAVPSQIFRAFR